NFARRGEEHEDDQDEEEAMRAVQKGSLYKQKSRQVDPKTGKRLPGKIWWTSIYANGKRLCESTGTDDEREARRGLAARAGRVEAGWPVLPRVDRITYNDAAKDLREFYRTTGTRNMNEAERRLKRLDPFFAGYRLAAIDGSQATRYIASRQEEGAANATVN